MADEVQAIRSIQWRDAFPFTHLFRAFRVAIHPSKLILALAALLLVYAGGRALDGAWPTGIQVPELAIDTVSPQPRDLFDVQMELASQGRRFGGSGATASEVTTVHRGIFISFFEYEVRRVRDVANSVLANNWFGRTASSPGVFPSIWAFLARGPGLLIANHWVFSLLFFSWFLLVWSVFGGAVARIAAVHVARDEKISVRQALRFSISKVLSFLFAPLIPLLIILFIGAVVAATGWVLLHIPYVGPIATGLLFFLALLAGFIITLVALGTLGGFNLMFPTVAVEGSDSFDAISRSFSYVFARPWRMLFYTVVAIAYGALTYLFVRLFIFVMLLSTHSFVGWFLTGQPARHWKGPTSPMDPPAVMWPRPSWDNLTYDVDYAHLKWSEDVAAGAISFWVYLAVGLLGAFAISFYFSANTIIYYLMRREVDATELDDVYVEDTEDEFGEPVATAEASTPAPSTASAPAAAPTNGPAAATAGSDTGGARAYPADTTAPSPSSSSGPSDSAGDTPGGANPTTA